jgi:peroxiredoxin
MRNWHIWALLLLSAMVCPVLGQESAKVIGDFHLTDTAGKNWKLSNLKEKKAVVVVFLGTQCPINNAYLPRLAELHKRFDEKGVQFFAVNSNQHDTAEAIAAHAKEHAVPFPVLRDAEQKLADQFGAQRTPEAFVLDGKRKIAYQGRIDDQHGVGFQKPQPMSHDLADAITAVLDGKKVNQPVTSVAGCYITRAPRPKQEVSITFAKDVAGILQRNCQECHRPGQIGPMPLLTYDDASAWSGMIREVVSEKRMPPWHADARHGKFSNDRSLSKKEYDTLLAWIDQGCPQGDVKDVPAAKKFPEGWTIGKPDVVFTMPREFKVPALTPKGGVKYQNFQVPTSFAEDKWAQAIEVRPGSKATVHHILVYIAEGRKKAAAADGIGKGLLGAYAPGDLGVVFPAGTAKRIPKGATLVFQVHYTPNGVEQTDRSSIGIVFAKEPPRNPVSTRAVAQQALLIPPGAENHAVTSASTFKDETLLWSLFPHMHLRGKSFEYKAVFPDGKTQTILSVPKYDFNWQVSYRLAEPLKLPAGSRIECKALFDNSRNNFSNPDPTKWVFWGNQTWEEMMIGFVDYTTVAAN